MEEDLIAQKERTERLEAAMEQEKISHEKTVQSVSIHAVVDVPFNLVLLSRLSFCLFVLLLEAIIGNEHNFLSCSVFTLLSSAQTIELDVIQFIEIQNCMYFGSDFCLKNIQCFFLIRDNN